ncbi:class II aldolase/adducin family protein [Ligilactobacillus acidipiscis]|uniref:Ribulose-5-phosphate 4-epimerase and related epimerases and aldolases n=1 Tax=Ligilactobacillus acidipiscis TaxID=89059 RepID=A0A1K1KR99_9LACO|nr:class II aldolase/adducin family protein [Ligilactobacillus acidipiscis]SFV41375.1 Ribulose-5-phosphate 4-epimerase and related epimerases and aldolases [Ligilactobacillus acidipiscis]
MSDLKEIEQQVSEKLVWAGQEMCRKKLTSGTAGNISIKISNDLFAITPSGTNYFTMQPKDIVFLNFKDEVVYGDKKPSIEKTMHRMIYQSRQEVNAIVHTHSTNAIAAASSRNIDKLPTMELEMVSYLGGDINIADFAPAGSLQLANNVQYKMGDRAGVLLRNHGALGVGIDIESAFTSTEILEKACLIYLKTLAAGGPIRMPADFVPTGRRKYLAKFNR